MYHQQQQAPRAPRESIGILSNEDPVLHRVVMTNIKKETTVPELNDFIIEKTGVSQGSIVSIDLNDPYDTSKKVTKWAEVVFDSTRTTDQCIANFYKHGDKERQLAENTMNMRRSLPDFIKKDTRKNDCMHAKSKKLFVASLPKDGVDLDAELKKHVESLVQSDDCKILGEIESTQVIMEKDPATGARLKTSKGFAFIHVTSEHLADKLAIQCGGGFDIGGRRIDFKKDILAEARSAGGRGGRGAGMMRGQMRGRGAYGAARGGRGGGYAGQQQYGAYPPQPYGGEWDYSQQGGYAGYGQQGAYGAGYEAGYGPQAGGYGGYGQQAYGGYQ